jgi:hypothetical protein
MAEYSDENRGVLFKNDRKEPGSKHPDYRGKGNWNGRDCEIAAWIKEGRNGKFLSLSFKEPYEKPERGATSTRGDFDRPGSDDIDF